MILMILGKNYPRAECNETTVLADPLDAALVK